MPRETSPSSPSPSPARTVDTVDDLNELVGDALVQVHNGEMSVKRAEAIARMAKVKKTLMTDRLGTKDRIQRLTDVELVSETQALLVELQRDIVDPIDEEEEAA